MGHWPTNSTLGSEEEGVDMWIDLRDYGECCAKVQV